jgi:pre-mRNA cleavage complex 2 protein Pcf11
MASYEDHTEGVAEDYRDALEALTMNSRFEISNLTSIARENVESAHAISEVLIEHIKKVGSFSFTPETRRIHRPY